MRHLYGCRAREFVETNSSSYCPGDLFLGYWGKETVAETGEVNSIREMRNEWLEERIEPYGVSLPLSRKYSLICAMALPINRWKEFHRKV